MILNHAAPEWLAEKESKMQSPKAFHVLEKELQEIMPILQACPYGARETHA